MISAAGVWNLFGVFDGGDARQFPVLEICARIVRDR
jgi:hypothetical protein